MSFQLFGGLGLVCDGCINKMVCIKKWFVGCLGIVKLGCGWCCGVFHGKNCVGLVVRVSNCKINWVGVVVWICG